MVRAVTAWTSPRILVLAVAGGVLLTLATARANQPEQLTLSAPSAYAGMASGGDVVVEVRAPASIPLHAVVLTVNGADVSDALVSDPAGHALRGLVQKLDIGRNVLIASSRAGRAARLTARLEIVNHPLHGPVFSGPRQTPWVCETDASGLGAPTDEHCTVPTNYDWFYKSTAGMFRPLPDSTSLPGDIATATTIDDVTVKFIVRVESGTINGSIYRIAILADPARPISQPWSAGGTKPGAEWNGKLFYHFLGGCAAGFRSGKNAITSALDISDSTSVRDEPLRLGYAVAFGTRNTLGTGCNDVMSAETVAMIKERFIEQYGVPAYTVGLGSSGGAMQQHLIAQNYPGLLNAITPVRSYPDTVTVTTDVIDCGLLNRYFNDLAGPAKWPGSRRSKVDGYPVDPKGRTNCTGWNTFARSWPAPTNGFDEVVASSTRYDPIGNRKGARGTYWDGMVNAFGVDPSTGFARQTYDNVGVQYGLKALNEGSISKEEFLDLNEQIGGIDVDGNFVSARTVGDPQAIDKAYRTGRVNAGGLTLPVIHYRNYVDFANDIHTFHRSFAVIARLQTANGTAANLVRWTMPQKGATNFMRMALLAHDEWQRNLAADEFGSPYAVKVIRAKPASLTNGCWDEAGVRHDQPASASSPGVCNTLFPVHADPRIVAGAPVSGDILKCQLKPMRAEDYRIAWTGQEWTRLQAIFSGGVCDWSRPGVNQRPFEGGWLSWAKPGEPMRMDTGH
jgi:hypothetical protein